MKTFMFVLSSLATWYFFHLGTPHGVVEWIFYSVLLAGLWLWFATAIVHRFWGRYHVDVWRKRSLMSWHYITRDVYGEPLVAIVRLHVRWNCLPYFHASVWDLSPIIPAMLDWDDFRSFSKAQTYCLGCLDVASDWYEQEVEG